MKEKLQNVYYKFKQLTNNYDKTFKSVSSSYLCDSVSTLAYLIFFINN